MSARTKPSRPVIAAIIAAILVGLLFFVWPQADNDASIQAKPIKSPSVGVRGGPLDSRPTQQPNTVTKAEERGTAQEKKPEPAKPLTAEEDAEQRAKRVHTMIKWIHAYALDNGGNFPSDTSELLAPGKYGFAPDMAADYLSNIIEYRGRGLTNSDDGRLVLIRFSAGPSKEFEVRGYVGGSVQIVPTGTPIPEDEQPAEEVPR